MIELVIKLLIKLRKFQKITNEHDKEISQERHISPEERQKIIDDLRLI